MQCLLLYYSPLILWLLPKTVLLNGRLSESLSSKELQPSDLIASCLYLSLYFTSSHRWTTTQLHLIIQSHLTSDLAASSLLSSSHLSTSRLISLIQSLPSSSPIPLRTLEKKESSESGDTKTALKSFFAKMSQHRFPDFVTFHRNALYVSMQRFSKTVIIGLRLDCRDWTV